MADLYPTKTRLALLRDIADGKVADDPDGTPMLHLGGGERTKVASATWELESAGWIYQAEGYTGWQIAPLGRDVLKEHADA